MSDNAKRFTALVNANPLTVGVTPTGLYDNTSPNWGFRYRMPSAPRHYVDIELAKAEHKAKRERQRTANLHAKLQNAELHHSRPVILRRPDGTIHEHVRTDANGKVIARVSGVSFNPKHGAILAPAPAADKLRLSKSAPMSASAREDARTPPAALPTATWYRRTVK